MHYILDIDLATRYDVNVAIFLQNIAFWTKTNIANNKHYHDGHYWTYNSMKAFSVLFPFWTIKQIRVIIQRCIDEELLIKGNYNHLKYDQTSWYALTQKGLEAFKILMCPNGQMVLPERANESAQKGKPIPDINTDINTDVKISCPSNDERNCSITNFDYFWSIYPKKQNKKDAQAKWKNKKCDESFLQIIDDIKHRLNHEWKDRPKNFIPSPDVYLNKEKWTDERIYISDKKSIQKSPLKQPGDVNAAIEYARNYAKNYKESSI